MKNISKIRFTLAFFIAMLFGAANIQAAEYDLWICGTRVTDDNKNNLSSISGVSGSVSYNSENNILRLNDATITYLSGKAILSEINGLKIELVGTNTISGSFRTIEISSNVSTDNNTTITGNGTLNVSSPDGGSAIFVYKNALTIKGCTINANGDVGFHGLYASLIFEGANVTATGSWSGSIFQFNNGITLNGCSFISPANAQIINGSVCDAGGNIIKSEVKIGISKYDLWICGEQVTDTNKDDLSVINGVTGTVSYNSDSKTLTLNNANITIPDGANAIKSNIEGLTIDVQNNNSVSSNGWATMRLDKSATISGSGTLNVSQTSGGWTVYVYGSSSLTIKNCSVNAISSNYRSITGDDNGTLIINNATVTSKGATSSISNFANITLNGCVISKPVGAVVSKGADTFYAVRDALGNIITDTVKIKPITYYDLWICGEQVTNFNKDDLSNIAGVTGTVSYNSDSKTLTLNNANITIPSGANAIRSSIDGLTVDVQNNNTVNSDGYATMRFEKSATINGGGTLSVSQTSGGWALFAYGGSFNIENCTVNATSDGRAITSKNDNSSTLTINNATITAKGSVEGSITHFANIILNGCVISKPVGAVVSKGADTFYAVRDALGNIITDTVKIEPETSYNLWIWGTQVTNSNCGNLATLAGATEGSISYDHATTTLTLNGVRTDNSGDQNTIKSSIDGLKINIVGSNTLKANGWSLIDVSSNSTIEGSGTLNIENTRDDYCINVQNSATLTIKNCNLNVACPKICIHGNFYEKLIFDNATVSATNNDFNFALVDAFNTINLINCFISEPAGARIINGSIDIGTSKLLKILPGTAYNLWVGGVRVTPANKDDLSIIPDVTGTVSYNPDTRTLLLDNATINNSGIIAEIDGLIMELVGISEINAKNTGILSYQPFTIQGLGSLNVNSETDAAIWANSTSLTVKNCILNAAGFTYGVFGDDAGLATLNINNANVSALSEASGAGFGSIVGFDDIKLFGCAIVEPAGAVFDNTQNAICVAGTIVNTKVKIEPIIYYDFAICDIGVSNANKNDLTVIDGVEGIVNYNPDTKTLRLENATINATSTNIGIYSEIEGFIIELVGNNTVTTTDERGIIFEKTSTIQGSGTLNVNAKGTYSDAISIDKNTLTIRNCMVSAIGDRFGIVGFNGSVDVLNIENATVIAKGPNGSIRNLKELNLINCVITQPKGAVFNPNETDVCDAAGNIIKDTVKIELGYTITFATPAHGTLLVKEGATVINNGENVAKESEITITATPDNGYKLKTLTVNGNPFESGNTHIVVADVNIVAEFVSTGIEDFAAQGINIYPNPVQDILHIETEETITAVSVYNMLGSIVAQNSGDVREINISNLPAGIYMVRVEMGESVGMLQIVKK